MNKYSTAQIPKWALLMLLGLLTHGSASAQSAETGTLKVHFVHIANNREIVLLDSTYRNAFDETYSIKKLKYYVSHATVPGSNSHIHGDQYYLVNAADDLRDPLTLILKTGKYDRMEFLLGVDSAANCSGAQTGALDPMNDMFWTWNSGYVVFKLEGFSSSSNADMERIEHHIGGYKGENNVSVTVSISTENLSPFVIRKNETTDVYIALDLDRYWKGTIENKISEAPLITTAGVLAKKISANFAGMFYFIEMSEKP